MKIFSRTVLIDSDIRVTSADFLHARCLSIENVSPQLVGIAPDDDGVGVDVAEVDSVGAGVCDEDGITVVEGDGLVDGVVELLGADEMVVEKLGDTDHETDDEIAGNCEVETDEVGISDTEAEVL